MVKISKNYIIYFLTNAHLVKTYTVIKLLFFIFIFFYSFQFACPLYFSHNWLLELLDLFSETRCNIIFFMILVFKKTNLK